MRYLIFLGLLCIPACSTEYVFLYSKPKGPPLDSLGRPVQTKVGEIPSRRFNTVLLNGVRFRFTTFNDYILVGSVKDGKSIIENKSDLNHHLKMVVYVEMAQSDKSNFIKGINGGLRAEALAVDLAPKTVSKVNATCSPLDSKYPFSVEMGEDANVLIRRDRAIHIAVDSEERRRGLQGLDGDLLYRETHTCLVYVYEKHVPVSSKFMFDMGEMEDRYGNVTPLKFDFEPEMYRTSTH